MSNGSDDPIAVGATMQGRTGGHESEWGAPNGLVLLSLTGSVVRATSLSASARGRTSQKAGFDLR